MNMGFTYNDITSKSMGIKAHLTSWQLSGSLTNYTTTIPGKYGVSDFGADYGSREITVSCNIYPKSSFNALVLVLDDLAAWLDPVEGLKELIFDDVPDRYFMARLNDKVDCERLICCAGEFDLTFFCPDPFGYAVEDESFSITEEGETTITRELGNIESNPIYRLTGAITESSTNYITIATNGEELTIVNAELDEDEALVIDSEKMTAYVEDENGDILRNALPYLDEINFPKLSVGDNTIDIESSGTTFTKLEIQAKSRWR